MARDDFAAQLAGYSLTTAEILYRMPDHLSLIQTYVWQDYDLHPRFPLLKGFLDFWTRNLEGPLVQVTVQWQTGVAAPRVQAIAGFSIDGRSGKSAVNPSAHTKWLQ